jgi:type VI protein secretion system component Hcp
LAVPASPGPAARGRAWRCFGRDDDPRRRARRDLLGRPRLAALGAHGIQIGKRLDKVSRSLVKWCASGRPIPTATLIVRAADVKGAPQTIVLTDATVDPYGPYDDKRKSGNDKPTEQVSFAYNKDNFAYDDDESDILRQTHEQALGRRPPMRPSGRRPSRQAAPLQEDPPGPGPSPGRPRRP